MEFRVLGPFEVLDEGRSLAVTGLRQRSVLAVLVVHANSVVSVGRLVDAVWEEHPTPGAVNGVQVYISGLRRVIGRDRIVTTEAGYRLVVADDEVDARRFARLSAAGSQALAAGDAAGAVRLLGEALALWRGPALADFQPARFAHGEAARLDEMRLETVERRVEALLQCARHEEAVAELGTWVAAHPLRERLRGLRMLALYRCGRQAEALEAYQSAREVLRDELGLDPGPELVRLHAGILAQDPALAAPSPALRHNLPAATGALIGRRKELSDLQGMLRRSGLRLLTLTGAGGIGKTRLALAAAESVRRDYPDGVFVVWLAGIGDPDDVVTALARTLEVAGNPNERLAATLARALASRRTLLVLDNFEHVLAAATLLTELLAAAPGLRVLVTSRARLRLSGEHDYPVPPLRLPELAKARDLAAAAECEAVALFVERAAAVRPDFTLGVSNVAPVVEICLRLDGLPLAIELAAARSRALPPQDLLHRLQRRLAVLTGGPRDLPARQQTLRATIEWTYQLLNPAERQLFERFAVFVGGATLAAVEAICPPDSGEAVDVVEQLLDQSLLIPDETYEQHRYVLLETIREYALERLDQRADADEVRRRHAAFFLGVAETGEAGLRTAEHPIWLRRFDAEHGNLRAAFETLLAGSDRSPALALAAALFHWWEARNPSEGRQWLTAALADEGPPTATRAKAQYVLARIAFFQGEPAYASALLREVPAMAEECGSTEISVLARGLLGWIIAETGDEAEARTTLAGYPQAVENLADPWSRAEGLMYLGGALVAWDVDASVRCIENSLALTRRLGEPQSIGHSVNNLGSVLLAAGQYERAGGYLEEALAIGRELQDEFLQNLASGNLGILALVGQRHDESIRQFTQSARLCAKRGDRRLVTEALAGLAAAYAEYGYPEHCARLAGAAAAIGDDLGIKMEPLMRAELDRRMPEARRELGPGAFAELTAEGRAMSPETAVAYALTAAAQTPAARPRSPASNNGQSSQP